MQPDETLGAALESAYRVFDEVPCPKILHTSPLRDAEIILRTITAAPLRRLTSEQIGPYAGWAITTVGSASDYQHFLPRILELAVEDATHLGLMAPVIASKVAMSNWAVWPIRQRTAIVDVFRAAFEQAVEAHPDDSETAPEWLCGLARLGKTVDAQLAFWRSSTSQNAALQLAEFMRSTFVMIDESGDLVGFWEDVDPPIRQTVGAWVVGVESRRQLERAFTDISESDRWMIEAALERARRITN